MLSNTRMVGSTVESVLTSMARCSHILASMTNEEETEETEETETEETTAEELTELEKEFRAMVAEVRGEIERKLEHAYELIRQAEKISDTYGLPFDSKVSPLWQSYTPQTYFDKYGALDAEVAEEVCNVTPGGEYGTVF